MRRDLWTASGSIVLLASLLVSSAGAQSLYQKPPKAIQDVLDAPSTPLISPSPTRDRLLFAQTLPYPSIAEVAAPMLRLAGLRINAQTNGPHSAPRIVSLSFRELTGKNEAEKKLELPAGARIGSVAWSPLGKKVAFTNTTTTGIELWVADAVKGEARKIPDIVLNGVLGDTIDWMPDGQTLICRTVPAARGRAPLPPAAPSGPIIQESIGKTAPVRTYQDLLETPHDEALFDYYATSQLALVDSTTGQAKLLGQPAVFAGAEPSPDGKHFLVARIVRPYSYLLTLDSFPKEIELWDASGRPTQPLHKLPLADQVPIEGVPTGPRGHHWRPTADATLIWVEAQDGGDPKKKVPHRDRLLALAAPFEGEPRELTLVENRYAGVTWGATPGQALLRDYDRDRRWSRTFLYEFDKPEAKPTLIWDRSVNNRYEDPGSPVMRTLRNGQRVMWQHEGAIFLSGQGATPEGDRPFLDRFELATQKKTQLFRSAAGSFESVLALMSDDGTRFLTRYESPQSPPNYVLHTGDAKQQLTDYADPAPALRKIEKKLVTYKRPDGVQLSFTLYLPPDFKPGQPRPTVLWAYPQEFNDPSTAGQVVGSSDRFTTLGGISHLFFLLEGYVVLDAATMPVVGEPETANNTFLEQVVASAQSAIDKAVELGVTDRDRVGVGGHSYGAFMTANLLAHSELFRSGIARSGAYNRTLTPFGFQNERRTLWEAPEIYLKVSPFLNAHKIKEPILLIHGEIDNNAGTFPIQSERLYQAIRGNGGHVRFVSLPFESHGYSARESVEHTLHEMITWFDQHVKQAPPREK